MYYYNMKFIIYNMNYEDTEERSIFLQNYIFLLFETWINL